VGVCLIATVTSIHAGNLHRSAGDGSGLPFNVSRRSKMRILTTLLLSLTTLAAHAQTAPGSPLPEPSTMTLLGVAAVVGIAAAIARKRRK
jgi:hypothetical protein